MPGPAADLSTRSAASLLPYAVLAAVLAALLAVHIQAPWQFIHDDNGRRYSSYARSHLTLGLSTTHAQDFFYDPQQRTLVPYGHHPPGLSLALAGWFWLWGGAPSQRALSQPSSIF